MKTIVRWLTVAGFSFATLVHAQEIVKLPTRVGVAQSYFLAKAPKNPQAVAVLFPGGNGLIDLRKEGDQIKFATGNFVVRARNEFVKRGAVAAIIDAPSDKRVYGMDDQFRFSDQHFTDISAVVADLNNRFPGVPLFLIGTSRGTVSAAPLAVKFNQQIAGVALTSTPFRPTGYTDHRLRGPCLSQFDLKAIKIPLLFVHHAKDGCVVSPYSDATRLTNNYPLITVFGSFSPKSDECSGLSAHGYYGKEPETVEEIVNWMLKKPFRIKVE